MGFWPVFWGATLLVGVVAFAALTLVVAAGGVKEIRALFERSAARYLAAFGGRDA